MILIEFLLYELNSVDGHKNSAESKLKKMMHGQLHKKSNRKLYNKLDKHDITLIEAMNKNMLLDKIILYFKILRIRMKISYHAFLRKLTVQELFYKSILKTYNQRKCDKLIEDPYPIN